MDWGVQTQSMTQSASLPVHRALQWRTFVGQVLRGIRHEATVEAGDALRRQHVPDHLLRWHPCRALQLDLSPADVIKVGFNASMIDRPVALYPQRLRQFTDSICNCKTLLLYQLQSCSSLRCGCDART